jgi:hypothetical protein
LHTLAGFVVFSKNAEERSKNILFQPLLLDEKRKEPLRPKDILEWH